MHKGKKGRKAAHVDILGLRSGRLCAEITLVDRDPFEVIIGGILWFDERVVPGELRALILRRAKLYLGKVTTSLRTAAGIEEDPQ